MKSLLGHGRESPAGFASAGAVRLVLLVLCLGATCLSGGVRAESPVESVPSESARADLLFAPETEKAPAVDASVTAPVAAAAPPPPAHREMAQLLGTGGIPVDLRVPADAVPQAGTGEAVMSAGTPEALVQEVESRKAGSDDVETSAATVASFSEEDLAAMETDSVFLKRLAGKGGMIPLDISVRDVGSDGIDTVGIDEAVAFALQNNFEIKASDEGVKSGFWDKMGAYGQYLPSMNLTLSKGRERSRPASINDANGDRVGDDRHQRRDRDLSIRQPILDLQIISDILSSTGKEDVAKLGNRDTRETIASQTVTAFYAIVQARVAVALADQYKTYLDDVAARMSGRVEEGGAPTADLDRISARALLAESARAEAMGEYEAAISEFRRLTGIVPQHIEIPHILAPMVPETADEAVNLALRGNPSYLSSIRKIDVARADTSRIFADMVPTISGEYESIYSYDAGGSAKGNPVDGVYPSQRTDTMFLVAKWGLSPGTAVPGGMSGLAKIRQAQYQSRDIRSRIEQGVSAAYTALGAAEKRKQALRESVAADERVIEGFEEQYKEGGRPLFDLLDAYEQLYGARLNLMRVVIADVQASYQVRKQIGDLIPSVIQVGGR